MEAARRLILRHRRLAAWLIVAALCMKILVPQGFMPVVADGALTIQICPGKRGLATARMDHGSGHGETKKQDQGAELPCAFAGLSAPSLAAIDPILLAIAVAAIAATVFRLPDRVIGQRAAYFRPPPRAPPAVA